MDQQRAREMLAIDPSNLHLELVRHPQFQEEINREYARACGERDTAKHELDKATAICAEALRGQKGDDNRPLSETRINSMLADEKMIKVARAELIRATTVAMEWQGLYEAARTRAYMLRDLTSLASTTHATGSVTDGYLAARQSLQRRPIQPR